MAASRKGTSGRQSTWGAEQPSRLASTAAAVSHPAFLPMISTMVTEGAV